MKTLFYFSLAISIILIGSCTEGGPGDKSTSEPIDEVYLMDASSREGGSSGNNGGSNQEGEAGLITAGEWNDLIHWDFWNGLVNGEEYGDMDDYWSIYTNNRIPLQIISNQGPLVNATVELMRNGTPVWTSRTDNSGKTEMWIGAFQNEGEVNYSQFSIRVNNQTTDIDMETLSSQMNIVNLDVDQVPANRVELAFIVDATGSMADELEFLKADLQDVIEEVEDRQPQLHFLTSTVFYRDEGDEYVYKTSEFTKDLGETISFIGEQSANGGGDFPEAVHTALNAGINELEWSSTARTRLAFLVLDAPPHYEPEILADLQSTLRTAAEKGIKVIPVTASGIDKETEFLMRMMAILTNGTYVFITDDSGIGNDHLEPSVGEYQVEKLNDLLVRLIDYYAK